MDGGGHKGLFVVPNIGVVKPFKDNNSLVCMIGDCKDVKVTESTDQIEQMIAMETIGLEPSSTFQPAIPQIAHE